jgi:hypothetical protein
VVDFDDGESQRPQPCPDAKPHPMQSALSEKPKVWLRNCRTRSGVKWRSETWLYKASHTGS